MEALQPSLPGVIRDCHGDDVPYASVSRGFGIQITDNVPVFRIIPGFLTLFAVPTLASVNNLLLACLVGACGVGRIIPLYVQDGTAAREHLGLFRSLQVRLDVLDGSYLSPVERGTSTRSRTSIRVRRETLVDTDGVVPPPKHVGVRNVGIDGHDTSANHGQGASCKVDRDQVWLEIRNRIVPYPENRLSSHL